MMVKCGIIHALKILCHIRCPLHYSSVRKLKAALIAAVQHCNFHFHRLLAYFLIFYLFFVPDIYCIIFIGIYCCPRFSLLLLILGLLLFACYFLFVEAYFWFLLIVFLVFLRYCFAFAVLWLV